MFISNLQEKNYYFNKIDENTSLEVSSLHQNYTQALFSLSRVAQGSPSTSHLRSLYILRLRLPQPFLILVFLSRSLLLARDKFLSQVSLIRNFRHSPEEFVP